MGWDLVETAADPNDRLARNHAANGLGGNRVEQFGFCFSSCLVWWQMVALAISLVRFWFEKKRVWFGSVVAALKSLKSTAEDASNLEASGLADGCPLDDSKRRS